MKIQTRESGDETTFQIEGRLAGVWVPELEQCWHAASANHPGGKISVDLSGMTFVDQAGEYLLRLMRRDGVSFTGTGLALKEVLR